MDTRSNRNEANIKQAKLYPSIPSLSREVEQLYSSSDQSNDNSYRPDVSLQSNDSSGSFSGDISDTEARKLHDDLKRPVLVRRSIRDGSPSPSISPECPAHAVRRAKQRMTTNIKYNESYETQNESLSYSKELTDSSDILGHPPSSRVSLQKTCMESKSQSTNKIIFTHNLYSYFGRSVAVFVIVIGLYYFFGVNIWYNYGSSVRATPRFEEFREKVNGMKKSLPDNDKAWSRLIASSTEQFLGPPAQPSVAVLVYRAGAEATARCMAVKFAEQFSSVFASDNPPHIVPEHLIVSSKQNLDISLRYAFDRETKVAIFPRLDKFDGDSLLLMHDYCDDQHAPYKNVSLIFEARLPETVTESSVEQYVTSMWAKLLGADEAGALISRVWRNVAFVENSNLNCLRAIGCN